MELHEVKIGDTVTFKNKGKKVVGKVIHRHDERKSPHLYGHVNVQKIGGAPSYPITIHISKLQPMLEGTHMEDLREDIKSMLQDIIDGNNVQANATFEVLLQQKIAELVDLAKVEVAGAMFSTQTEEAEYVDEGNAANKAAKNAVVQKAGQTAHWTAKAGTRNDMQAGRNTMRPQPHDNKDAGRIYKKSPTEYWKNKGIGTGVHEESEQIQEAKDSYEINHEHYNSAVGHAAEHIHKKTGLHVHENDLMNIPRKPAAGETNHLRFQLHKDGQPTNKYAHVQVYHHDGKTKKPFELNMYHDTGKHKILEDVEQIDEVITKKTATGEVIRDFIRSKNPKFKGKSKKERIRMALGAKYSMMKETLVGGQKKLDMNHNNKLDAQDFKIIRKKKK